MHLLSHARLLVFDSELKQLYVSAESGNVTVFVRTGRLLLPQARFPCRTRIHGLRRLGYHLVYFSLQNIDGHPLLRIMFCRSCFADHGARTEQNDPPRCSRSSV